MTDFGPDFAGPDGYAEVARPVFLGLDPLLLALLIALILIAGVVGWALGRSGRREDDPEEVAKAIHARILAASKAALSVDSDRLPEKSRALKTLVDEILGDAVKLGAGVNGPLQEIANALDPKPAAPTPPPAASATLINVTVNPTPPTPAPPVTDQRTQLALAVRKFHDHWSRTSLRKAELKGARLQLSTRPAADAQHPHGHGDHDDHDDHSGHEAEGHGHADDHADADNRPIWERMGKKTKKG